MKSTTLLFLSLLLCSNAHAATSANGDKVISALQLLSSIGNSCAQDTNVEQAKNLLIQSLSVAPVTPRPAPPPRPTPRPAETFTAMCPANTTDLAFVSSHSCEDMDNTNEHRISSCAYDMGQKECVRLNATSCEVVGSASYSDWKSGSGGSQPSWRCEATLTFRMVR